MKECYSLNGCDTGEAKITKGYHLKARHIIHTVGPIYSGMEEDKQRMENCYWNSLTLARQYDIHSIAFQAISTGVYGYPLDEAVPIALLTIARWLQENEDYEMAVIISCFDQWTFDKYQAFCRK